MTESKDRYETGRKHLSQIKPSYIKIKSKKDQKERDPVEKQVKDTNKQFSKKYIKIKVALKYMRRYLFSLIRLAEM